MPEDKVMKKLSEHDKLFKSIDKRFDFIDKRLDEHDKRFDSIDKQFERNEEVHSNIAKKLLEHDDKFEQLSEAIKDTKDTLMTKMDQILGVVSNLDTERYAIIAKTDSIEVKLEFHDKDIKKIKKELKLAWNGF